MNTVQLRSFIAVATTLNFAKAAEIVNLTQPAVTQQIRSLEDELGTKLFRRSTRSVELTTEGFIFLDDAESILNIAQRAERKFRGGERDLMKEFRIGCHAPTEIRWLSEAIKELKRIYPNIYPIFEINPFRHLYKELEEEKIDVVVSFKENISSDKMEYHEASRFRIMALLPEGSILNGRDELTIKDLEKEKVILLEPKNSPDALRKAQQCIADSHGISDMFFSVSPDASIVMCQAGFGVSILYDQGLSDVGLKKVPVSGMEAMSFGIYSKRNASSAMVKSFIDSVKRAMRVNTCGSE